MISEMINMKTLKTIRQGDVLLQEIKKINTKKQIGKDKFTLAYGEKTGHHHDIIGNLKVFETPQKQILLEVERPSMLTHQEHQHIKIEPGLYKVVIQREYTLLDEVQHVID